jgi:GMP reductase
MKEVNLQNISLNYNNILLKSNKCIVKSRSECDISTNIANKSVKCPVFCANMPSVLTKDICKIFDDSGWFHVYHRIAGIEDVFQYVIRANEEKWNFISISIGVKEQDYKLLSMIKNSGLRLDSICIDIALSWQESVKDIILICKENFPNTYLIVGNGDNPLWINWLENLGVDAAKINIGVSSSCRTKQFTGFGSTTITDLENCANEAKKIKIISDGGLTLHHHEVCIGDCTKAIRFGASYIMSGALFKNCIDSPSITNGYFGNASRTAKGNHHVEGTHLTVETNGLTIREMIKLVEDSLRSSVSYSGGTSLKDLRKVNYEIIL